MNLELMAYLTDRSRLWAIDEASLLSFTKAAERADSTLLIEAAAPGATMRTGDSIAVIGVSGPVSYRPNVFTALFGGAAITSLQGMFRQALADDSVKAIVMRYDTPGGEITGLSEFANEIMAARGRKPIIAQVDTMAASAGYHLAAAADRIEGIKSGVVGSIGIIAAHADLSGALEKDGVKVTIISAGKYKSEGTPTTPLTDEAHAAIQARVDEAYGVFVGDIAKFRGVSASDVRDGYGEGRAVSVAKGKALGLVDGISSLDDTVAKLSGRKATAGLRAELADVAVEQGHEAVLAAITAGDISPNDARAAMDRRRRLERF